MQKIHTFWNQSSGTHAGLLFWFGPFVETVKGGGSWFASAPTFLLTLLHFASLSVISHAPNTTHRQGDQSLYFFPFGVAIKKLHTTNLK
jgi:hypothetical protein